MRELVGRVPPLGYDRVQQAETKVAQLAKVTGRRDCETFSLALVYHLVSIFPRVLEYAACLFLLIPFVFSRCTMVSGDLELRGNPLHLPKSQSFWSRCGGLCVSLCCFRKFVFCPYLCQHVARVL